MPHWTSTQYFLVSGKLLLLLLLLLFLLLLLTNNMYRLSKDQYNTLLNNSITSTYKKSNSNIKTKINISGRNILEDKEVLQPMDINSKSNCFITLKDHKDNFQNNPSVQLINPAKIELGRFSKLITQAVNKELRH